MTTYAESVYRMTCYSNISAVLERLNFLFFDASPADNSLYAGELSVPYNGDSGLTKYREAVGWRETEESGVVEVTDYFSGRIYTLLGDITTAEELALTIATAYAN